MTAPLSQADIEELRVDAPHLDQPQLVRVVGSLLATIDAMRGSMTAAEAEMAELAVLGSMSRSAVAVVTAAMRRGEPR